MACAAGGLPILWQAPFEQIRFDPLSLKVESAPIGKHFERSCLWRLFQENRTPFCFGLWFQIMLHQTCASVDVQ